MEKTISEDKWVLNAWKCAKLCIEQNNLNGFETYLKLTKNLLDKRDEILPELTEEFERQARISCCKNILPREWKKVIDLANTGHSKEVDQWVGAVGKILSKTGQKFEDYGIDPKDVKSVQVIAHLNRRSDLSELIVRNWHRSDCKKDFRSQQKEEKKAARQICGQASISPREASKRYAQLLDMNGIEESHISKLRSKKIRLPAYA